ncbi:MAG: long-chain-fatty-acid--CoA ligase [Candidatus Omnitrophica bacterium]|nr:long-chain-fatty-acid--CoA ligase [Candidatus Omnitrophota bacterium]MBD3269315.1 long-chain-fatty-acid--CoA ligase [Candidatus Omnitrophota bacterium]
MEVNNLVDLLRRSFADFPARTAISFGTKKITYSQLEDFSSRFASALHDLGVREGDRVAIWLPNRPEFIYAIFGILKAGGIVVPINTMFKREEARFILEDCRVKVLICSLDKVDYSLNITSRCDSLKHLICIPGCENKRVVFDFYELIDKYKKIERIGGIDENTPAFILYTSGTTGVPKGACLSHKNIISNVKGCSAVINFSKKDCTICILPLFHSFALTVCVFLPLLKGAKIALMRSLRPFKRVIRSVFKNRVTVFVAVPAIYNILAEIKLPFSKRIFSIVFNPVRICISGAAALPYPVWKKFEQKFRRKLLQGYGLTEASPVVSLNPLGGLRKPDSIGKPLSSVEVKVISRNGKELSVGEVGELMVKGPNVMAGYYNAGEETEKIIENGWLHTGDLARIDNDGYIYIMGRKKEMINVRGLNVYPREIEDLLYKYPKIKEAAVVGARHKHRGEVPVAFIVKQGEVTAREILSYLKANLASYKCPLKLFFKESLPKNLTGKILKKKLQEEVNDTFQ